MVSLGCIAQNLFNKHIFLSIAESKNNFVINMKKSTILCFAIAIIAILVLSLANLPLLAEPLKGRVVLGYSSTSGNSDEEKVSFNFNLKEKKRKNLNLLYDGLINYGKSSGKVNADKKQIGIVGEIVKDAKNSWYVQSEVLKDRFAGYETRLSLGAGYFRTIIAESERNLKAAAGLDITKEDFTDSTSDTRYWLKLGLQGDRMMAENIKLLSSIDYGAPKNDFKDNFEVDFSIGTLFTVNLNFDFETRYIINYRKTPLVQGKEKTDSTFTSSFVYKM